MSEKAKLKKGQSKRNKFAFLVMWLTGHMLAWLPFIAFVDWLNPRLNDMTGFVAMGLIVGGITSLTQYLLIRWQFRRNLRLWIPLSVIAWLVATLVVIQPLVNLSGSQIDVTLQAMALFTPAAIVQAFLLRKQVQQAWLWLMASVAGTTTFALPIVFDYGENWTILAGYGLYAGTLALTLLWLFGMSGRQMQEVSKDENYNTRLSDEAMTSDEYDYQVDMEAKQKLAR